MAILSEEQWELDGTLFGKGTPTIVLADGLDYGASDPRTQDVERPQADGLLLGRDYLTPPELELTLGVGATTRQDVWPLVAALAQAWRADAKRSTPGALSVLRHRRAGVTYRYVGRPRTFAVQPAKVKNDFYQSVAATFQLVAPEVYLEVGNTGAGRSIEIRLVAAPSTGGVVWPATWPLQWFPNDQEQLGTATVGGVRPAPFRATIYGPVTGTLSGIKVSGTGWEVATSATLAPGQSIVIDTTANTITRDGVSIAGTLSRKSRLTARLAVGSQFLKFSGTDSSLTAKCVVTWLDTLPA